MRAKKGDPDAVTDLEESQANQMHLFAQPGPVAEEIKEMLGEIDPNRITPVEALMKFSEMKKIQDLIYIRLPKLLLDGRSLCEQTHVLTETPKILATSHCEINVSLLGSQGVFLWRMDHEFCFQ